MTKTAEDERAAVVTHLNFMAGNAESGSVIQTTLAIALKEIAKAIERGDHHKGKG